MPDYLFRFKQPDGSDLKLYFSTHNVYSKIELTELRNAVTNIIKNPNHVYGIYSDNETMLVAEKICQDNLEMITKSGLQENKGLAPPQIKMRKKEGFKIEFKYNQKTYSYVDPDIETVKLLYDATIITLEREFIAAQQRGERLGERNVKRQLFKPRTPEEIASVEDRVLTNIRLKKDYELPTTEEIGQVFASIDLFNADSDAAASAAAPIASKKARIYKEEAPESEGEDLMMLPLEEFTVSTPHKIEDVRFQDFDGNKETAPSPQANTNVDELLDVDSFWPRPTSGSRRSPKLR